MPVKIPTTKSKLTKEHIVFLEAFTKSCRNTILKMTTAANSGHPGGSLSSLNFLSLLYTLRISKTNEPVIISNGHIAPALYSILAELGIFPKSSLIKEFRQVKSIFEGHVSRSVPGIWYGTGPLGTGISAATGFALAAQKQTRKKQKVFATLGDGEMQEGQVYEMMNFASKYALNNLIVFLDFNKVQLSDSLKHIMPIEPAKIFRAAGWRVITTDGHDFQKLWSALKKAESPTRQPTVIIGNTIMGHGVSFMETTGRAHQSDWHGQAATKEQIEPVLTQELSLTGKEKQLLKDFQKQVSAKFKKSITSQNPTPPSLKMGKPKLFSPEKPVDCRTAYGHTLLDLTEKNKQVLALTADLSSSVKTDLVRKKRPGQHIECGIAEQHMVSMAGGLSLSGYIPFVSTFGAFMTSRAKDQARVNDLNDTNVKMVATHCGLSVGKDGPTHQAIDDIGSFLGLFNTKILEPADGNHTVHIIRSVASQTGNCYVRMGRHKLPILTKENGKPFFDETYSYTFGQSDRLRQGHDLTVCASGSMVAEAFAAWQSLRASHPKLSIEMIIMSSPQVWDSTVLGSIKKTKRVLIVEDHTTKSGYASQLAKTLLEENIQLKSWISLGVDQYQSSGEASELYEAAQISHTHIRKKILEMLYTPKKQKILSFLLT